MRYEIYWDGTDYHGYCLAVYDDAGYDTSYYLGRGAIDIIRLRAIEYMKGLNHV